MSRKQERLPGTGDAKDARLEDLAGELRDITRERLDMQKVEKSKHDALLFYMTEKGITVHHIDDTDPPLVVRIKQPAAKVSVREEKDDGADADDGDIDFDQAVETEASAAAAEEERLSKAKAKKGKKPPKAKKAPNGASARA